MNNTPGVIILSEEDSLQLRQDVFNPTSEYLRERQQYFEKLDSSMVIHRDGSRACLKNKNCTKRMFYFPFS